MLGFRRAPPAAEDREASLIDASVVPAMQQAMSGTPGACGRPRGLDFCAASERLRWPERKGEQSGMEAWEATNLMTVATAMVASARLREESRGAHGGTT